MPKLELAPPEFLDTAPFRVVTEVTVAAPISRCWELLADQASWVQWFDAMAWVEATPWIWTEPGQKRRVSVNGLTVHEQAISVEPEKEYAFSIVKWPLLNAVRAAEGVRLADASADGETATRLTYIGAFESTWLGGKLEGVLGKQLDGAWKPALEQLGRMANTAAVTP